MLIRRAWPVVSSRGRVSWLVGRLRRIRRPSDVPPFRQTVVLTALALALGVAVTTAYVVTRVGAGQFVATLLRLLIHSAAPIQKKKRNVQPPKVTDAHGRRTKAG